ncbi:YicC/YloC family endoribonuclease [Amorphus sp. 3PC139-8]|uniref:YicC/YloC family endoribonuclease n=1 Tax=Amorphus sp. 3PC139-8 TaxID=2735676 RepID=UPI00345C8B37
MTLSSMTGFAAARGVTNGVAWAWEARSVNGRGLDVRVRLPQGWERLDPAVRERVTKRFKRGSVSISLSVSQAEGAARYALNERHLETLLNLIRPLQARGDVAAPTADGLLALKGVLEPLDTADADDSALTNDLIAGIDTALGSLEADRHAEGARLGDVVRGQVQAIAELAASAREHPSRSVEAIRDKLAQQVAVLLEASASLDRDRLHQEAALLATRADIAEELDRLDGHVEAAKGLLDRGGAVGRRLDFLAQEFHREANTLTSKSVDRAVTAVGLELKVVIDQLREQVQNLE